MQYTPRRKATPYYLLNRYYKPVLKKHLAMIWLPREWLQCMGDKERYRFRFNPKALTIEIAAPTEEEMAAYEKGEEDAWFITRDTSGFAAPEEETGVGEV